MSRFAWILALAFSFDAAAQTAPELAPGVHWLPGEFVAGAQPDGNTVIFDGGDGLVVFDTGRHARHTQQIIDYANAHALPVAAIVNSHWHLDHVGGNALLREKFPGVHVHASVAIEDAMHGFLAKYRAQLESAVAQSAGNAGQQASYRDEIALIDAGAALYPDAPVRAAGPLVLAGRKVRVGLERSAVTAGDVWLFDPATRVLAAGDLVTLPAPLFDTACPARWQAALGRLARNDFSQLVPGHGAPMRRAQFATYRRAFDGLLACAASSQPKAACVEGWMRDADALIPAADRALARSLVDYYVDNSLRVDPAKTRALCAH
jgi:glyoxylase-like metal-dependent hydrolase (beta-lactamase superfamily II)